MAEIFEFAMGATVKDRLTKFKGVVTGRSDYLNGCKQYLVKPTTLDSGKMIDGHWLDEQRLELMNATIFEAGDTKRRPGGPQSHSSAPGSLA